MRASGLSPRRAASSDDISTVASAPSEILDDEAAVNTPSFPNAARSPGIFETSILPGSSSLSTTVSPLRPLTVTGTISASNAPDACAACARLTLSAEHAHRLAVVRIGQAIPGHVVEELGAAVADAGARTVEQVRGIGHRLHAAGNDHLRRAGLDQVMAEHHRLHARAADLVDGGAASRSGDACGERCLSRRGLAEPGRQHATH